MEYQRCTTQSRMFKKDVQEPYIWLFLGKRQANECVTHAVIYTTARHEPRDGCVHAMAACSRQGSGNPIGRVPAGGGAQSDRNQNNSLILCWLIESHLVIVQASCFCSFDHFQ